MYQTGKAAIPRTCGFHGCSKPLYVLFFYPPIVSRYCIVDITGDMKFGTKSRVCGTQITIIKEITLLELIKLHLRKEVRQNGLFGTI